MVHEKRDYFQRIVLFYIKYLKVSMIAIWNTWIL